MRPAARDARPCSRRWHASPPGSGCAAVVGKSWRSDGSCRLRRRRPPWWCGFPSIVNRRRPWVPSRRGKHHARARPVEPPRRWPMHSACGSRPERSGSLADKDAPRAFSEGRRLRPIARARTRSRLSGPGAGGAVGRTVDALESVSTQARTGNAASVASPAAATPAPAAPATGDAGSTGTPLQCRLTGRSVAACACRDRHGDPESSAKAMRWQDGQPMRPHSRSAPKSVSPEPAFRWRMSAPGTIQRSTDGGVTWKPQVGAGRNCAHRRLVSGSRRLLDRGARRSGAALYRRDDMAAASIPGSREPHSRSCHRRENRSRDHLQRPSVLDD